MRMKALLRRLLGLHPDGQRIFALDEELAKTVYALAEHERRPPGELVDELLADGLAQREMGDYLWQRWRSLSRREQQVAALACLGYTNRQIAARLTISPETVKTHVRNVLRQFDLHSKEELRALLAEWDFSAWEGDGNCEL